MAYNRASNSPVDYLADPFPKYTPLEKVRNNYKIYSGFKSDENFKTSNNSYENEQKPSILGVNLCENQTTWLYFGNHVSDFDDIAYNC